MSNANASRGNFSQLPPPGPSANSSTNGNGNLENELEGVSPQVGPAESGASPSFLRLAAPSRHSALSTSGNIVERERRLREGSFSSTGPVAFIAERGGSGGSAFRAVGAGGGIELDLGLGGAAGGGAEEANEEAEINEPDIFDEFEVTPDINAEYTLDFFNDEVLKNMPPELFDNLIEALETIEEEDGENSNNNRNAYTGTNANAAGIIAALQQTKETLKKLDQEKKSVKSSASNKVSSSSLGTAKESTIAVSNLAKELLRVGTGGVVDTDADAGGAGGAGGAGAGAGVAGAGAAAGAAAGAGVKRTRIGRESTPPTRYDPEIVRKLIRRTKIKSKRQRPGSLLASGLSDVSNMTALTATKAFLMAMKGSRIEGPKPDSQLKFIHGKDVYDSINENTLCDLCGFALKYRQPDGYYKEGDKFYKQLKWSYDHTIPVNYAAAVLRIYLTNGHYSLQELQIMSYLGGPTCFHCNSVKSQQKFITCLNAKRFKWRDLRENRFAIDLFLKQLLSNETMGKNAKNLEGNTSLQRQIERIVQPDRIRKDQYWIKIRTDYLAQKCHKICELIKAHVDYDSAYARVKLMRSVINGERAKLQSEGISAKDIKKMVSKKAKDALFNCKVQPWNSTVDIRDYQLEGGVNPFYTPAVTIFNFTAEKPWAPAPGKARTRKRKQMRKRTRKNLRLL
jgi:hypothetical protein